MHNDHQGPRGDQHETVRSIRINHTNTDTYFKDIPIWKAADVDGKVLKIHVQETEGWQTIIGYDQETRTAYLLSQTPLALESFQQPPSKRSIPFGKSSLKKWYQEYVAQTVEKE